MNHKTRVKFSNKIDDVLYLSYSGCKILVNMVAAGVLVNNRWNLIVHFTCSGTTKRELTTPGNSIYLKLNDCLSFLLQP